MLCKGAIFQDDRLLVECELLYVFADPVSKKSKPVPSSLRELLTRFEAGESIYQVKVGSWGEIGDAVTHARENDSLCNV